VNMLNAFYGLDAAKLIIEERQQALRRSAESSRRAGEARRTRRARKPGSLQKGWAFRRPQPRPTGAFRLEASC